MERQGGVLNADGSVKGANLKRGYDAILGKAKLQEAGKRSLVAVGCRAGRGGQVERCRCSGQ